MPFDPDDILEKQRKERADKFVHKTLVQFYEHLLSFGFDEPKTIKDKYRNPNPLKVFKVYTPNEILLTHYLLNEGLISAVVKNKNPLLIKGSITQKGLDYIFMEQMLKL